MADLHEVVTPPDPSDVKDSRVLMLVLFLAPILVVVLLWVSLLIGTSAY